MTLEGGDHRLHPLIEHARDLEAIADIREERLQAATGIPSSPRR